MNVRVLASSLALGASSLAIGGCATVINGTHQPVDFRSDPAGADAKTVTGLECTTPCKFSMRRGDDSRVTFTKPGYKPVTIDIQSRTGGGTFGNIIAGGIIGGVVDGSNGAANHLYPDPVYVRLIPEGSDQAAVLLNKKGEIISTVDEYNAKVRDDVEKGLQKQGIYPMGATLSQK